MHHGSGFYSEKNTPWLPILFRSGVLCLFEKISLMLRTPLLLIAQGWCDVLCMGPLHEGFFVPSPRYMWASGHNPATPAPFS